MSTLSSNARVLGNFCMFPGQYLVLFGNRQLGLIILLFGSLLNFPFFIRQKQWDVVLVIALGFSLNLSGVFLSGPCP